MKKLFIIIIALFFLSGCASWVTIEYDAATGSFAYNRFGDQELQDLQIKKSLSETEVLLGQQKSKSEMAEQITEILKVVRQILEAGL